MTGSVLDAARNVAEDYPGGARALAARIDKNATSFAHELAETGTAKLGLATAVKMTARTRDLRILNAFAADAGCMVLPLPEALAVEGDHALQQLATLAREFADVVSSVTDAVADGTISANELARVERQYGELIAAGQAMLATLHAQHEAGRPGALRAVG